MFSASSIPAITTLAGPHAFYEEQQLQTVNRAPCRKARYHPYISNSLHNNGVDYLRSYSGYQLPYFPDFSPVSYEKKTNHLVTGYPKVEELSCKYTNGALGDYSYPTLNFLLPTCSKHGQALDSSLGTTFPSTEFSGKSSARKRQVQDELHPFYKRQMLASATPRDGLTRTRDKYRVVYTEKQRERLEEEYQKNSFISEGKRTDLAKETDLSERQIKFWFQNRRAKDKRNKKNNDNPRGLQKKKENDSFEMNSQMTTLFPSAYQEDIKHVAKQSCKFSTEQQVLEPRTTNDHQQFTQITEYQANTACQFSVAGSSNVPDTQTPRSCQYENRNSCSQTGSKSPTGYQVRQLPESPSEWTLTNQKSYLIDRVYMSPLFNSVQPTFDFRI